MPFYHSVPAPHLAPLLSQSPFMLIIAQWSDGSQTVFWPDRTAPAEDPVFPIITAIKQRDPQATFHFYEHRQPSMRYHLAGPDPDRFGHGWHVLAFPTRQSWQWHPANLDVSPDVPRLVRANRLIWDVRGAHQVVEGWDEDAHAPLTEPFTVVYLLGPTPADAAPFRDNPEARRAPMRDHRWWRPQHTTDQ